MIAMLPLRKINLVEIDGLVDREYPSVSVLDYTRQVAKWLKNKDYYAVVNENGQAIGVMTLKDINNYPCMQVIDCSFAKPYVEPGQTIFEAFDVMKAAKTDCLPVQQHGKFIGVISLAAITEKLISVSRY